MLMSSVRSSLCPAYSLPARHDGAVVGPISAKRGELHERKASHRAPTDASIRGLAMSLGVASRRWQRHGNSKPLNDFGIVSPKMRLATQCAMRQNEPLRLYSPRPSPAPCRKIRHAQVGQTKTIGRHGPHGHLGRLAKNSPFGGVG